MGMDASSTVAGRSLESALAALQIAPEYAPCERNRARSLGLTPLPRLSYAELLRLAHLRFGDDHTLFEFVESKQTMTVGELETAARRFACALLASGFVRGDTLVVWSPPGPVWPAAMFGAASIGVRVCGANTRYRREELVHLLRTCRPRAIIAATGFLDIDSAHLLRTAIAASHGDPNAVSLETFDVGGEPETMLAAGSGVTEEQLRLAMRRIPRRAAALVQFSSGSTGAPKAVLLSQSGTVAAAHYGAECVGLDPSDRLYSPLPFSHIGGTVTTALAAVASGCRAVVPQRFHAQTALKELEAGCTAFQGHGALWRMLLDEQHARPRGLPWLRKGWASGDFDFLCTLRDELGVSELINMYGSSEAGTIACTLPCDPPEVRLGALGHTTPGTRAVICDETGSAVPDGEVGELWLSGVMTMLGYMDEASDDRCETDWVATGDLVVREKDVLSYRGRVDDRLKPGGENVSIAEVEEFIAKDPHVDQVVVVGVPDARLGEVPAAVVRAASPWACEASIIDRCRGEIAGFKVPKYVRVVDDLPTLDTGKIDRRRVRDELVDHLRTAGGVAL